MPIDQLVSQFFLYLPRAFSAVLILVIGYVLAGFISRAVLIAAVNSGYQYAKLLAEAVRLLLTVLILAMVLEQLQVAPGIVLAAFSIIFGGIVIALAISFGVGGIDAAKRMIERETVEKQRTKRRTTSSISDRRRAHDRFLPDRDHHYAPQARQTVARAAGGGAPRIFEDPARRAGASGALFRVRRTGHAGDRRRSSPR